MNAEQVYPGLRVIVVKQRPGKAVAVVNGNINHWWVKYEDDGSMANVHVGNMELADITEIEIIL